MRIDTLAASLFFSGALFVSMVTVPILAAEAEEIALVGRWEGTWSTGTAGDRLYLTVKKVEGDAVFGTLYIQAPGSFASQHNRDLEFKGKLEGNTLTIDLSHITAFWSLTLTIEGNKMTGASAGGLKRSTFELTKVTR